MLHKRDTSAIIIILDFHFGRHRHGWNSPKNVAILHRNYPKSSAILFLGESGTGKSTQTKLWTENVTESKILNDDSPFVRIEDGVPYVYGSPWSGKGRCYINEKYPIKAIIRLKQAEFNKIKRQNTIKSFGAIWPSCPPSFVRIEEYADSICNIISEILKSVPVYKLYCLPDKGAVASHFAELNIKTKIL